MIHENDMKQIMSEYEWYISTWHEKMTWKDHLFHPLPICVSQLHRFAKELSKVLVKTTLSCSLASHGIAVLQKMNRFRTTIGSPGFNHITYEKTCFKRVIANQSIDKINQNNRVQLVSYFHPNLPSIIGFATLSSHGKVPLHRLKHILVEWLSWINDSNQTHIFMTRHPNMPTVQDKSKRNIMNIYVHPAEFNWCFWSRRVSVQSQPILSGQWFKHHLLRTYKYILINWGHFKVFQASWNVCLRAPAKLVFQSSMIKLCQLSVEAIGIVTKLWHSPPTTLAGSKKTNTTSTKMDKSHCSLCPTFWMVTILKTLNLQFVTFSPSNLGQPLHISQVAALHCSAPTTLWPGKKRHQTIVTVNMSI